MAILNNKKILTIVRTTDTNEHYSKTETDTLLDAKANVSDTFTKSETQALIDSVVAGEIDLTNYYTKAETDDQIDTVTNDKIGSYTNIANPANKEDDKVWYSVTAAYTQSGWSRTTIKVKPNTTYTTATNHINDAFSWFTNESNENLGKITVDSNNQFTTPANCTVIKISKPNSTYNFIVLNTVYNDKISSAKYASFPYGTYFDPLVRQVDCTATPTADKVAKYDSNASMETSKPSDTTLLQAIPARYGITGFKVFNEVQTDETYGNADNLPVGSIVTYIAETQGTAFNFPFGTNGCTIMTYAANNNVNYNVYCQLAMGQGGLLAYRYKFSKWGDWYTVEPKSAFSVSQFDYVTISMFEKWGAIGDSFTSGGIYGVEGVTDGMYYNVSYPRIIGRKNGVEVTNYSQSGATVSSWLSNATIGLPKLLTDDAKDLYTIMLGINESTDNVGTIEDITSDYTQNPNTFYGNMARVIEQIKVHAPKSKIVLVKPPITAGEIKTAIQDIAEHYGIAWFDLTSDPYISSDFYKDNQATYHPVAITYSGMAMAFERQLTKCIQEFASYFFDYH